MFSKWTIFSIRTAVFKVKQKIFHNRETIAELNYEIQ